MPRPSWTRSWRSSGGAWGKVRARRSAPGAPPGQFFRSTRRPPRADLASAEPWSQSPGSVARVQRGRPNHTRATGKAVFRKDKSVVGLDLGSQVVKAVEI